MALPSPHPCKPSWAFFLYTLIRCLKSQGLCTCCSCLKCSLPQGGIHSPHQSLLSDPALFFFIAVEKQDHTILLSYYHIKQLDHIICPHLLCLFHKNGHSFVPLLVFRTVPGTWVVINKYVSNERINLLPNAQRAKEQSSPTPLSLQIDQGWGLGKGV